jgi:hypothetical protein
LSRDRGSIALPGSPGDFAKLLADETEKWGKVIRDEEKAAVPGYVSSWH